MAAGGNGYAITRSYYTLDGQPPPLRAGASHAAIYPYGPFACGDGKQVVLAVQHDREWATFCNQVLQLPELTAQYLGNANRLAQREKLRGIIEGVCATLTAAQLVARLQAGESLALVSDAGTPLVSDPGFRVVRAARAAGIKVSPVPGACAAIAALSVAGLPSDRFTFEGFLPAKASARRERLSRLAAEPRTLLETEWRARGVTWARADLAIAREGQSRQRKARVSTSPGAPSTH